MDHGKAIRDRDRTVVETDAPVVTRRMLGAYPRLELLVLLPSVESIERDALLDLPGLEAVVVDVRSECVPEDCRCAMKNDLHGHVPVFRVDTGHPPAISLPDTLFKAGYPFPVLMHSARAGVEVEVSDGRMLTSTREGYEMRTMGFGQGHFTVGGNDIRVVEWAENKKNCGIPENAKRGSVDLRIPYGACKVGGQTYYKNTNIRSARIPATVKEIGWGAFAKCANLTSVELASGVREINGCAFTETGITNLTVPGSVTAIRDHAFYSSKVQTLALSKGLRVIGNSAFSWTEIKAITIPCTVRSIGFYAFHAIGTLKSLVFEEGSVIRVMADSVFRSTRIKSLVLPKSVKYVGFHAFRGSWIHSLTLPESLKFIGDEAFYANCMISVHIPAAVMVIGSNAFQSSHLETVTFEEGSVLKCVCNEAFRDTKLTSITFPPSVESLYDNVFENVPITRIEAPGTAKFEKGFLKGIQAECTVCFYNCKWAPDIEYPANITVETREGSPFAE